MLIDVTCGFFATGVTFSSRQCISENPRFDASLSRFAHRELQGWVIVVCVMMSAGVLHLHRGRAVTRFESDCLLGAGVVQHL